MAGGRRGGVDVVLGLELVGFGILFLLGVLLGGNALRFWWPLYVIVPGLLFFAAMAVVGRGAGGLAIPGSIVTVTGLLLLFQNTSGHWRTWAYAWALIFPTSVGLGMMIHGVWGGRQSLYSRGQGVAGWGLVVFAIGASFFELTLNLTGLGRMPGAAAVLPLLLIGLGVYLLVRRMGGSPAGQTPPPRSEDAPPLEETRLKSGTGGT